MAMTLMITEIPPELNDLTKLNNHFQEFGSVVNMKVKLPGNRATVQFDSHAAAVKALHSPRAVLDNRFITVMWMGSGTQPQRGPRHNQRQQQAPIIPEKVSETLTKEQIADRRREAAEKKVAEAHAEITRKGDERRAQLDEQKGLLHELETNTSLTKEERADLMTQLQRTMNRVATVLKKDTNLLEAKMSGNAVVRTPAPEPTPPRRVTTEKERLDEELDSLNKRASDASAAIGDASSGGGGDSDQVRNLRSTLSGLYESAGHAGVDTHRGGRGRGRGRMEADDLGSWFPVTKRGRLLQG
eukprot:TRINITY_DN12913_c0_g1_i1.p1 TRINITY_DN12913_c0_g1~~TRINITY_DN12913_c0_g1_i1.p1  ORF type:complete len:300 (+),score=77.93 TRINITY_DN12913_c0_g1_i1:77-976(+)